MLRDKTIQIFPLKLFCLVATCLDCCAGLGSELFLCTYFLSLFVQMSTMKRIQRITQRTAEVFGRYETASYGNNLLDLYVGIQLELCFQAVALGVSKVSKHFLRAF